jgi:hypothetical protein
MKLINCEGKEVRIGDAVLLEDKILFVASVVPPHKPSSSGLVCVHDEEGWYQGYYPSVFNMKWRKDTEKGVSSLLKMESKMKTVHVVAWEFESGGGFDWYRTEEAADTYFEKEKVNCDHFHEDNWEAVQFSWVVGSGLTNEEVTEKLTPLVDAVFPFVEKRYKKPPKPMHIVLMSVTLAVMHTEGYADSVSEWLRDGCQQYCPDSIVLDWQYSDPEVFATVSPTFGYDSLKLNAQSIEDVGFTEKDMTE